MVNVYCIAQHSNEMNSQNKQPPLPKKNQHIINVSLQLIKTNKMDKKSKFKV